MSKIKAALGMIFLGAIVGIIIASMAVVGVAIAGGLT